MHIYISKSAQINIHICLVVHVGGKLIRNSETAQWYLMEKYFIGYLYILPIMLNYNTNIVYVLLAVDLQVKHVTSSYDNNS